MTATWVLDYIKNSPNSRETLAGILQASRNNYQVLADNTDNLWLRRELEGLIQSLKEVEKVMYAQTI